MKQHWHGISISMSVTPQSWPRHDRDGRMHIYIRIALALAAAAISFTPAWPWGNDGHRTIGMVADLLLANAPAARDAVSQILEGVSLSVGGFGLCGLRQ